MQVRITTFYPPKTTVIQPTRRSPPLNPDPIPLSVPSVAPQVLVPTNPPKNATKQLALQEQNLNMLKENHGLEVAIKHVNDVDLAVQMKIT
jgi:hypothetical protein